MMCCCPGSFVGKGLEAIGIVKRMRSWGGITWDGLQMGQRGGLRKVQTDGRWKQTQHRVQERRKIREG